MMPGRLHVLPASIVLLAALTGAPTTADAETRQVSPTWSVQATPHRFAVLLATELDGIIAKIAEDAAKP